MIIPPGSTIGILGGGQLGRMLCMAAARLGYRTHIYATEGSGPAADVSAKWVRGSYDDLDALRRFAAEVDVVTFEFENIPVEPLSILSCDYQLHPRTVALATAQDRIAEKTFADRLGIPTAPWRAVRSLADLRDAAAAIGTPSILKTARFGYDGKGQARIVDHSHLDDAWTQIGEQPAILEGWVAFDQEFSIIAVRNELGDFVTWDAPENVHEDGILITSTAPAQSVAERHVSTAKQFTRLIAEELGYVGVLAVEFFAGQNGPILNEIAPRVHNSGHWTIEGAVTSQFENHIRAICGLPLGSTALTGAQVVMRNLIGAAANEWFRVFSDPSAHLHLYGKHDARAGRKMGHVTWIERAVGQREL